MALSPESRRGLREAWPWRRDQIPSKRETSNPSLSSGYGYLSAYEPRRESNQAYLSIYEPQKEQKQTSFQRWFASNQGDIATRREEKLRQKWIGSSVWDFWPKVDLASWWSWLWSATAGGRDVALTIMSAQERPRLNARLALSTGTSRVMEVSRPPSDCHSSDLDVSLRHLVLQRTSNWSVWRLSPRVHTAASALYSSIPVVGKTPLSSPSRKIRLLSLSGAMSLTAPLEASLEACHLDYARSFEALSYTWLGPFDEDKLSDDEIEIIRHVLRITGNLGHALRRLRHRGDNRCLWVDAICINQFDVQERGHQVTIMSEIYSTAKQVIVWLGEDSDSKDGAFVFKLCRDQTEQAYESAESSKMQRQLNTFGKRRYFSRRWIVQELVYARRLIVMCGSRTITWDSLCSRARLTQPHLLLPEDTSDMIINLEEHRNQLAREEEGNVLRALCNFSQLGCLDERDRVYALASLCKTSVQDFTVDYCISCTYVYRSFAASLVTKRDLSYEVLHIAAFQKTLAKREKGLPSWVPDWRLKTPKEHVLSSEGFQCTVDREWRLTATLYIYPADALVRKGISAASGQMHAGDLVCGVPWEPSRHFPQQWTLLLLRRGQGSDMSHRIAGIGDLVPKYKVGSIRWVAEKICLG